MSPDRKVRRLGSLFGAVLLVAVCLSLPACWEKEERPEWHGWDHEIASGIEPGGLFRSPDGNRFVFVHERWNEDDERIYVPTVGPEEGYAGRVQLHRTKLRVEWPDGSVELVDELPPNYRDARSVSGGREVLVVPVDHQGRCSVLVIDLTSGTVERKELEGTCSPNHDQPPGSNEKYVFVEGEQPGWIRLRFSDEVELTATTTEDLVPAGSEVHRQVDRKWFFRVVRTSGALEIRVIDVETGLLIGTLPMKGEVAEDKRFWAHRSRDAKCFAARYGANSRVRCVDLSGDASRWLLGTARQVPGAVSHIQHHVVGGRTLVIVISVTESASNGEVFTFAEAFDPTLEQPVWSTRWAGRFVASATRTAEDYKAFAAQTYENSTQTAGVQVTSVRLADGRVMVERRFNGTYRDRSLEVSGDQTTVELETKHHGQTLPGSMPFLP